MITQIKFCYVSLILKHNSIILHDDIPTIHRIKQTHIAQNFDLDHLILSFYCYYRMWIKKIKKRVPGHQKTNINELATLLFAYKRIKMIQIDMILCAYAINLNLNFLPSLFRAILSILSQFYCNVSMLNRGDSIGRYLIYTRNCIT